VLLSDCVAAIEYIVFDRSIFYVFVFAFLVCKWAIKTKYFWW